MDELFIHDSLRVTLQNFMSVAWLQDVHLSVRLLNLFSKSLGLKDVLKSICSSAVCQGFQLPHYLLRLIHQAR
jgi:hypothetical protein